MLRLRKMTLLSIGFRSVREAQAAMLNPHAPGSAAWLEHRTSCLVPHVKRVTVSCNKPLVVHTVVRMRWYAWLTLGLIHWIARQRVIGVMESSVPAHCAFEVTVR